MGSYRTSPELQRPKQLQLETWLWALMNRRFIFFSESHYYQIGECKLIGIFCLEIKGNELQGCLWLIEQSMTTGNSLQRVVLVTLRSAFIPPSEEHKQKSCFLKLLLRKHVGCQSLNFLVGFPSIDSTKNEVFPVGSLVANWRLPGFLLSKLWFAFLCLRLDFTSSLLIRSNLFMTSPFNCISGLKSFSESHITNLPKNIKKQYFGCTFGRNNETSQHIYTYL